ncbi:MAG: CocE/NonD family hydrolase, partial [Bacillota bacterium]
MDTVTEWVRVSGGANLATDVTLPDCGAYPVVIVRTVYGRKNLKSISDLLVGHGYATVVQDVR